MQGIRTAVTSANGDYIFPLLPPGSYTVRFELSGFGTQTETRDVAATQPVALNVTLKPASVSAVVFVTARSDTFVNTVQAATNFKAETLATLPTTRTLLAAVNLSPAVHGTGPSSNTTINGAMSFDNIFMLNGVQVQDNLRGTPFNLFIEDGIQEITISSGHHHDRRGRTDSVRHAVRRVGLCRYATVRDQSRVPDSARERHLISSGRATRSGRTR